MPLSTYTEVYQVKLIGAFAGQETINIFHFGANTYAGDALDLLNAWWASMQAPISSACSGSATWTAAEVQQEKGGVLFGAIPLADSGNVSGDSLPPFVSWDYTLVRGGALERNGYKRFAGVPESKQNSGVVDNSFRPTLDILADAMFNGFDVLLAHFTPVIKRNYVHHVRQTPPVYYDMSNVVYSKIGSQNSRKFGHGR
jgi:hypothetical protein